METISNLPQEISEHFNKSLLSYPVIELNDSCKTLGKVYLYIIFKLKPKVAKNPIWIAKIERLEIKFLELYERAKAKEIEYEKKAGEPFMQSFDFFREINRYHPGLFDRLRCKS